MVDHILEQNMALVVNTASANLLMPTSQQWDLLEKLVYLLKPSEAITRDA